ncbi:Outer membrane protein beta-barrel domain-containing protein [Arachidicoccus rhizosphaerae]|jgi:hypothetical protein|uniref:Outer membrane protein beta-barrel domain-containing protein n=1 Tax=Arachidicoccus rhizosphaerae TaxID=551991 RepID=A0A1H3VGT3_9BACT|nr:porin family protein [Arachidicoccus rhizosphaerae]SDZ73940.1 Outer membrane protein beta-barrel domain-containing protein [Arachidicoccus rhizosphaerae]
MKKLIGLFTIAICSMGLLKAQITDVTPPVAAQSNNAVQDSTVPAIARPVETPSEADRAANQKKKFGNVDLSHRGADHFLFQYGGMGLAGATDEYTTKGFSREFNAAFMLDKPFKTNPHYSLGFGIGYSSSNLFFNGKYVDIKSTSTELPITTNITGSSNSFNKFKVVLNYFEIPVELRYSANMEQPNKGFRIAFGLKGGYLLSAHSKGKNEISSEGSTQYGKGYIEKEYSKRFFRSTRLDGTVRIGYGLFSLYGTYQLTPLLNSGAGPTLNPFSIGLGIGIM